MDVIYKTVFENESVSISALEAETEKLQRKNIAIMESALVSINQMDTSSLKGTELCQCLAILAANTMPEVWNNKHISDSSKSLMKEILVCRSTTHDQFSEYLYQHREIAVAFNGMFRKALVRDVWSDKAVTCSVYYWYCHSLKYPLVSDYLDVLIPPALLFVDSYTDSYKLKGVQCLYHIMNECGRTELQWHGRAQVIYDALQKLTYSRDARLLVALHPAMLKILRVVEMDGEGVGFSEAIYCRLLGDMYLEDRLSLKHSYANSLHLYTKYLGSRVVKHLKLTMKVVLSYLEYSCGPEETTRITTLDLLSSLMDVCQPRIYSYSVDITKALLQLLVDVSMASLDKKVYGEILIKITEILKKVSDTLLVSDSISQLILEIEGDEELCRKLQALRCNLAR